MSSFDARVIGAGRAGTAMAGALRRAGWSVDGPLDRTFDPTTATTGAALVLLAVPDRHVASVAGALTTGEAVVVHLSGALGLDVLEPHHRVASVHPLVALPEGDRAVDALSGAWFAVSGDQAAARLVGALGGRPVDVHDRDRVAYHAAAVIASNHLVALLGQVDRLARSIGVPLDAYLDLARGALADVAAVGPERALTGPVVRGDWDTVAAHLACLPEVERPAYAVLADAARRLVDPVGVGGGVA